MVSTTIETRIDRNLERLLYNSSANIASLIALARLHEETVSRAIRNQSSNQSQMINLITGIIEQTASQDESQQSEEETFEPYSINDTSLFNECKYNTIESPLNHCCPISFDQFNENDDVILIRKCKHIFKKTSIESWLSRSHKCPYCRTNIG
jgi:hypothetical protein